jgi:molybdate transport system ATP-binding protein
MDTLALRLQLQRPGFALDVDMALPGRGISALVGPSGCGKTTVLRTIAGLERAAQGLVRFGDEVWQDNGENRFTLPHRRAIGYVIQDAALFPHLSVRSNLLYGYKRIAPAERKVELKQAVDLLGIGHLLERKPAMLSGGERQRVAIARALLTSPRLLLMDEPLAALDAGRKAEILPYLEHLHEELAMPIVYVTHALDEVMRLADHLVLMEAGRVKASGPLQEMLARTDLPLNQQDDAGVVIEAKVAGSEAAYGLLRIAFAGGGLWVGMGNVAVSHAGQQVRARVLARDVSVTREPPAQTSILNVLPVVLQEAQLEPHTALLRLKLGSEGHYLLARITRKSFDLLQLKAGDALHAQVKGVALMQ